MNATPTPQSHSYNSNISSLKNLLPINTLNNSGYSNPLTKNASISFGSREPTPLFNAQSLIKQNSTENALLQHGIGKLRIKATNTYDRNSDYTVPNKRAKNQPKSSDHHNNISLYDQKTVTPIVDKKVFNERIDHSAVQQSPSKSNIARTSPPINIPYHCLGIPYPTPGTLGKVHPSSILQTQNTLTSQSSTFYPATNSLNHFPYSYNKYPLIFDPNVPLDLSKGSASHDKKVEKNTSTYSHVISVSDQTTNFFDWPIDSPEKTIHRSASATQIDTHSDTSCWEVKYLTKKHPILMSLLCEDDDPSDTKSGSGPRARTGTNTP